MKSRAKVNKDYARSIGGKWRELRYGAKRRGIKLGITREQFDKFWQQACFYCGYEIKTIGLDRINNDIGYCEGNLVSFCKFCNGGKNNLTQLQWLALASNIVRKHGMVYGRV